MFPMNGLVNPYTMLVIKTQSGVATQEIHLKNTIQYCDRFHNGANTNFRPSLIEIDFAFREKHVYLRFPKCL